MNRAYIEDRSFGDMSFVLCVSDWPHTLFRPISVESVMGSEGSQTPESFGALTEAFSSSEPPQATWQLTTTIPTNSSDTAKDPCTISFSLAEVLDLNSPDIPMARSRISSLPH